VDISVNAVGVATLRFWHSE